MAIATLKFDLSDVDDNIEFTKAVNGYKAYSALFEIGNNIFRPARKHGYINPVTQGLLDKCGDDGAELISRLEDLFHEILEDNDITL